MRQTIVDVICAYLRMPYELPREKNRSEKIRAAQRMARAGRLVTDSKNSDGLDPHEELQVRLTAQRILAAHLRHSASQQRRWWRGASLSDSFWPDISLDLSGATLFNFTLVRGHLRDARFNGATFAGETWFGTTTFAGMAQFKQVTFTDHAHFGVTSFTDDASFANAVFDGDARFGRATFAGFAGFSGATFNAAASFIHVTFAGNIFFADTIFNGESRFSGAVFSSMPKFDSLGLFGQEQHALQNIDLSGARLTAAAMAEVKDMLPPGWHVEPDEQAGGVIRQSSPHSAEDNAEGAP
ncbi:pentapeptide repeat-containing protein [Streptosporangium canum]|uniref:pentapeptide repeat-containing protein n=1 Tax=Streptosporangium canum TaxID=324952 RepID=UPI00343DF0B3